MLEYKLIQNQATTERERERRTSNIIIILFYSYILLYKDKVSIYIGQQILEIKLATVAAYYYLDKK